MIKVVDGNLKDAKEIAFSVVGVGPFEEPGDKPGELVKTTMFDLHVNSLFLSEYQKRVDAYSDPFAAYDGPEYKALEGFRKEACRLVCSEDADIRQVGHNAFVVTWRRTVTR